MPPLVSEHARAVHDRLLVFDGHNDTPVERVHRGEAPLGWMNRDTAYNMDLPRMREGGLDGGFFIVGNGPTADVLVTIERTLAQVEADDSLHLVLNSADVTAACEKDRIGLLLAIEGAGRWLSGNIDTVRLYHRLGVRALGITHGEGGEEPHFLQGSRSPFSFCTPADREDARGNALGLTPFGEEVLRVSNELGMVTDLAHINDRAFYQVLERSSLPVTMTHTGVFSVSPHWRCMTDDQIKALADAGGVLGVAFAPDFIDPEQPTINRLVDHICYVAELVGIDHVAIGSDFDGLGKTTPVVADVSQLPLLTQAMLERGLTEEEVGKVWGENFVNLLQRTIG